MTPSMFKHIWADYIPGEQQRKPDMSALSCTLQPGQEALDQNLVVMNGPQTSGGLNNGRGFSGPKAEYVAVEIESLEETAQSMISQGDNFNTRKSYADAHRNHTDSERILPTDAAPCVINNNQTFLVESATDQQLSERIQEKTNTKLAGTQTEQIQQCLPNDTFRLQMNREENVFDENSEQPIVFQGDFRDFAKNGKRQRPQAASETKNKLSHRLEPPSSEDNNIQEEEQDGHSSLSEALIYPLHHPSRNRLKTFVKAVSRSLPGSPRVRAGQNRLASKLQNSPGEFRLRPLRERVDGISETIVDAESYAPPKKDFMSPERDERLQASPHSRLSPKYGDTSSPGQSKHFSVSSVRSVKTIVTKSTSVIDVSDELSGLSPVQRRGAVRAHSRGILPRSTSTPGLASHISSTSGFGQVPRFSEGMRELSAQPWSLSRAESLAEMNGYQHCIVCRACSDRAKQIRPGRHFVLSWKQIIALTFALLVYIAGGTLLFVELEYDAESKRQDVFVRFFEEFIDNHSSVQPRNLLQVAEALKEDSSLAILVLREMSEDQEIRSKQFLFRSELAPDEELNDGKEWTRSDSGVSTHPSSHPESVERGPNFNNRSLSNSSPGDRSSNINDSGAMISSNNSSSSSSSMWMRTSRVWNFPNSMGFVISALTTIGYGHVVPRTAAGRLTCVIYGVVGIPLMLLFLGGIGEKMRRMTSRFIMRKQILPCNKRCNQALNCSLLGMLGIMLLFVGPSFTLTYMEGWPVSDAVYYCFISLSTIGFGDLMLGDPTSASMANKSAGHTFYRLLSLIWVLFGLAYVGMCITSLAHLIIRGSCGANNVETIRLKAELKRLKHEIRAQRLYTRRGGLGMWTSQTTDKDGTRWDFDLIAEDGSGERF